MMHHLEPIKLGISQSLILLEIVQTICLMAKLSRYG